MICSCALSRVYGLSVRRFSFLPVCSSCHASSAARNLSAVSIKERQKTYDLCVLLTGKEVELGHMPRMLFLVHKWYVESSVLAGLLIDVYVRLSTRCVA